MTFLLITALIISLILNVLTIIIIGVQANKVHTYEEWVLEFQQAVGKTLEEMREIDKRGSLATAVDDKGVFESDDEVGVIFKDLEEIIERLNHRIQ